MDEVSAFLAQLRRVALEEVEKLNRLRELEGHFDKDLFYGDHLQRQIGRVRGELDACRAEMQHLVSLLLRIPPWHSRHRQALNDFSREAGYELSVFIMTKFPDGDGPDDQRLRKLVDLVEEGVRERGLVPRLATGAKYHEWLWDEVEVHLLGCAQGIAIVEDKYRRELNPNVAMEWGWMRAMGKRVHYLQEKDFAHGRADIGGLRSWRFDWEDPTEGVTLALDDWFGVPMKKRA